MFLKAKENAKNRARILLPRALRTIAMEIEGNVIDVPSKRQLFKNVKEKLAWKWKIISPENKKEGGQ